MVKRSKKQKRDKKNEIKKKRAREAMHERNRQKNLIENVLRYGKRLSKRQFEAYCYCRTPLTEHIAEELEWYSLFENRLLAIVIRDIPDNNFGFIILGRDQRKLFRCLDVSPEFHGNPTGARKALARHLNAQYLGKVQESYPQGDETDAGFSLFEDRIAEADQHPSYKVLKNEPRFEAARNLISEIVNSFVDNDGNYEREFQSINFEARLWELYLHIYLHNAGVQIENNHNAPDFEVVHYGGKSFIEATTVNASMNSERPDMPSPENQEEVEERLADFMPIKFGSALYSKLSKRYWEKDHVKGFPLVLAVHDYHNDNAMTWSRTALSEYLYGQRTRIVEGVPHTEKIETHSWEDKEIPSGFFYQENAENISAVLFSNQATIPKFNRMGKIAGLGSEEVKMFRSGYMYNPDPNAIHPIQFSRDLDDPGYEESWSDGLIMFHNPNARYPINPDSFADISHVLYSEERGFEGFHQPYDVLNSVTIIVGVEDTGTEA